MSETLDVFNSKFAYDIFMQKYSMNKQETWSDLCKRVVDAVCGQLLNSEDKQQIYEFMYQRWFIPGGRYLAAAGRPYHQVNNCFLFRAEDTREGWADLMQKATTTLMSGVASELIIVTYVLKEHQLNVLVEYHLDRLVLCTWLMKLVDI